ncbi:uncharacterized protein GIQ15_04664 [Arthroderma uncinatum]|uniref:uncharacterized protein n=1 Tax=Arthroderma uncinatum TaxID=74035 RepID=UPI00144AD35F|nr:uncharacterized protein GIQ15_04664 [Arthroderma uncinatum]KAF3481905.1 hypothetical protein GIQ15_04664 [Arthroderma uncinatum]
MDLEEGGRFFRPIPQSEFETWIRHEEFYEVDEWDPEANDVEDATAVFWKFWRLYTSEVRKNSGDGIDNVSSFYNYTPWNQVIIQRTVFGGKAVSDDLTNWNIENALDRHQQRDYVHPHAISFSTHGLYPDESTNSKLARSEMLLAIDIIMHRMERPLYITHHIYPVLMVACFNRHVRMSEVYFENGILHFNSTPFIDLNNFEKHKLDLYAR